MRAPCCAERGGLVGSFELGKRLSHARQAKLAQLVEQSPLPVRHTLVKLGIPRATFYRGTTATAVVGRKP